MVIFGTNRSELSESRLDEHLKDVINFISIVMIRVVHGFKIFSGEYGIQNTPRVLWDKYKT